MITTWESRHCSKYNEDIKIYKEILIEDRLADLIISNVFQKVDIDYETNILIYEAIEELKKLRLVRKNLLELIKEDVYEDIEIERKMNKKG